MLRQVDEADATAQIQEIEVTFRRVVNASVCFHHALEGKTLAKIDTRLNKPRGIEYRHVVRVNPGPEAVTQRIASEKDGVGAASV